MTADPAPDRPVPPDILLQLHAAVGTTSAQTMARLLDEGAVSGHWRRCAAPCDDLHCVEVCVVPHAGEVDGARRHVLWVTVSDDAVGEPAASPAVSPVMSLSELTPALLRATLPLLARTRVLEDCLNDEQARYELLVEAADVGDWDMDIRRNRTRRSLKHDMLLGYKALQEEWGYDDFLAHVDPQDRARVDAAYQRALGGEGRYDVEFRTTWPDGSVHWIASRGRFVLNPAGAPVRAAGVMTDITDRKLAEVQLTEIAKEESVGRLAAAIAHDFNNQLTVILGTLSILLDGPLASPGLREELERMRTAAEASAQLIRGLLSLSRHVTMRIEPLDLATMLREHLSSIERVLGPAVDVQLMLPNEPLTVLGDQTQLQNMILNLAANARDAIPRGGQFTITGTVERDTLRLALTDTGVGMDATTLAHCFDMFYTTKPIGRGTGLGLASVKRCLEAMRGTVEVQSAPGEGTTVVLTMPKAAERIANAGTDTAASDATTTAGRRILVVDDEESVLLIVARVLREAGYDVVAAASGEEAVARSLDAGRFDVLITDLIMPTMGGRAVAEAVLERQPGAKVLLMSGYSDDDIAQYGIDRGTYAFLAKPFTASMLLAQVTGLLTDDGVASP